ncbi:F0F1 ATP synthase subunit A [Candidatus Protochlamydia amoebophila]|nr:F0F1 ATP synthase subunit A [Candidatus Protochlamydia amoebophila]
MIMGQYLFWLANAHEPIENRIPELPNFISVLYHRFQHTTWAQFLHRWENIIFAILVASLISLVAYLGARKKEIIPSKFQNLLEIAVEKFSHLILEVLGPEGKAYIPFLGTLFIYIFTMNIFGMVPLMKAPSSSLNITAALAICVFCLVQFLNIRNMGIFGFLYHLAGSPKTMLEWLLAPLMFSLEIISQLSRPLTLALRLFGNVLGEDILIGTFALMGVAMISSVETFVGIPLQLPFMFLGLLTSFMQALVFTLLSTVYILLSMHKEGEKN